MNSIKENIRAKQLEFLKAVDEAFQQREAELRQVQRSLMETLRLVNDLLGDTAPAETTAAADRVPPPAVAAAGVGKPAIAWEQPVKRFP